VGIDIFVSEDPRLSSTKIFFVFNIFLPFNLFFLKINFIYFFKGSSFDFFIYSILGGLTTWDARHFLHIAEFGYIWESSLAFFPLFPMSLKILGGFLNLFIGNWVSLFSSMLIAGTLLNNVVFFEKNFSEFINFLKALFVINGMLLFRLTLFLNGGNIKESILAVYLHCWYLFFNFLGCLSSDSVPY